MATNPDTNQRKPRKGKDKTSAKTAAGDDGETEDEEGDEDGIIRCVCGIENDDEGRMMICCDNCTAWQHNNCMGITEIHEQLPDQYLCEQCAPEEHQDLIAAMARGERPWEGRHNKAQKKAKKGKGTKGKGRQAKSASLAKPEESEDIDSRSATEAAPTPPPVKGTMKRKRAAVDDVLPEDKVFNVVPNIILKLLIDYAQVGTSRRSSQAVKEEPTTSKKRKASAPTKATSEELATRNSSPRDPTAPVKDISELGDDSRKKAVTELRKRLFVQIGDLVDKGLYRMADDQSPGSLGDRYAILIEHALFAIHAGDPPDFVGKYRNQLLQIIFNVGKNETLLRRLLDSSLTPNDLATMSSDEMASEELQRKMAEMKKEAEKQSILVQEDGPRIRRTHKGEELVDDQSQQIASESLTSTAPVRQRDNIMPNIDGGGKDDDMAMSPMDPTSTSNFAVPSVPAVPSNRRSSSNFDINNVWSSVQSPANDSPRQPPSTSLNRAESSAPLPSTSQSQPDADIDRLLEDDQNEDDDNEAYSPTDHAEPIASASNYLWTGHVDMPSGNASVAAFDAVAHHVAGTDLAGRLPLSDIFPSHITLGGRIDSKRAGDYLSSLSAARSTDVSVHSIMPASPGVGDVEFDKLFTYLSERSRYGVLVEKEQRENVRDVYIVPLDAGATEMPVFLQRLEYNVIEQPRSQRMLLVVFVLKWKSPPPSVPETPSHGSNAVLPALSPVVGGAGGKVMSSSSVDHVPTRSPSSFGQTPINPYAQAQLDLDVDEARSILGTYYSSPVAQGILSQSGRMSPKLLRNLKRVFDEHPLALQDMDLFQEVIGTQH